MPLLQLVSGVLTGGRLQANFKLGLNVDTHCPSRQDCKSLSIHPFAFPALLVLSRNLLALPQKLLSRLCTSWHEQHIGLPICQAHRCQGAEGKAGTTLREIWVTSCWVCCASDLGRLHDFGITLPHVHRLRYFPSSTSTYPHPYGYCGVLHFALSHLRLGPLWNSAWRRVLKLRFLNLKPVTT